MSEEIRTLAPDEMRTAAPEERTLAPEQGKLAPEDQTIEEIAVSTLLERAQRMHTEGWRLAQACCTRLVADQEVNYSFDKNGRLHTLRVRLPMNDPVLPSISPFYWGAFLYENEMHDLFGVTVNGMAVDFHGHFYTTMTPTPYVTREPDHGD